VLYLLPPPDVCIELFRESTSLRSIDSCSASVYRIYATLPILSTRWQLYVEWGLINIVTAFKCCDLYFTTC
jgi:hypothetical protein